MEHATKKKKLIQQLLKWDHLIKKQRQIYKIISALCFLYH